MVEQPLSFKALKAKIDAVVPGRLPHDWLIRAEIRKGATEDLPLYIFSGSDDPVGQRLEGVRVLIDRYRSAGLASIVHHFYSGGRHEMLHETNRRDVITNLLVWMSSILGRAS